MKTKYWVLIGAILLAASVVIGWAYENPYPFKRSKTKSSLSGWPNWREIPHILQQPLTDLQRQSTRTLKKQEEGINDQETDESLATDGISDEGSEENPRMNPV